MKKQIVFDLDGTLITCKQKQVTLMKYLANKFNISLFDELKYWEFKRSGLSGYVSLEKLGVKPSISEMVIQEWIQLVETPFWQSFDRLFINTNTVLISLKRKGFEISLLTARQNKQLLYQQLLRVGLFSLLNNIYVVQHKKGDISTQKMNILNNINPYCYIGDTESDYYSAIGANLYFIGITTGQRNKKYLESVGDFPIVENLIELNQMIY